MLHRNKVAEDKTISMGELTRANKDRPAEDGTVKDKGVEFPVFSARVGARRKVAKKRFIEFTAREAGIENLGINANGHGAETLRVKEADEFARVALPKRKESGHANAGKIFVVNSAVVRSCCCSNSLWSPMALSLPPLQQNRMGSRVVMKIFQS